MSTVRIHNHGPEPIEIVDGLGGRTSMGESTGNVFVTPIEIREHAGTTAEPAAEPGQPSDEDQQLSAAADTPAEPATEFEVES